MKERERIVVTGLVMLMLLVWLGFVFHQAPRFAGSFWGGMLAVTGSAFMVFPLIYLFIKRIRWLKRAVTRFASMRTLLTWHIYAGVIGPILVLLHTGHRFESALGIALTGMTLVVVVSGFIGRYLMSFIAEEIRDKRATLTGLQTEYDTLAASMAADARVAGEVSALTHFKSRLLTWAFAGDPVTGNLPSASRALRLAESIADLEYAIISHQRLKRAFGIWLKFHIVISFVLYVLLGLHVWSAIYFGLRWFS